VLWSRDQGWQAEAAPTTGGDGTTVSRATEERALGGFKKLLSAVRESAGPKMLG
jgi:hypothetical protein